MENPEIIDAPERQLVGMRMTTCLAENRTVELWRAFKPRIGEIVNRSGDTFFSVQIYDPETMNRGLTPDTRYEKWAAVEVSEYGVTPHAMRTLTVQAGLHAVFVHRGTPQMFAETARFIFGEWLPSSQYKIDARPQFEIMPADYRPDNPEATEEVWVPVAIR